MSVHKRTLPSGRAVWSVRWRESERNRARDFDRKRDADSFDAELRRRRRLGELELLDAGRETLADFAREWWRVYADPHLARKTREVYADLCDRHILGRLGGAELRRITPEVVESFQAELRKAGVGDPTILKTLALLQGILQRAVVWRRIGSNPVAAIKKPPQRRKRVVRPIAPKTVEALRASFLARRRLGDAALVSVLAYAGLRPAEALALQWRDVQDRTLIIERAVALGDLKRPKRDRRGRFACLHQSRQTWRSGDLLADDPPTSSSFSRRALGDCGRITIGATGESEFSRPPRKERD